MNYIFLEKSPLDAHTSQNSGGDHSSHDVDHGGHGDHMVQPLVILFIFYGLLMGGLLRELYKRTLIPYTPMLIVFGILVGYYRKHLWYFGASAELASTLNPHMILFIFIPVLIFESAFNCDWYIFKKIVANVLLLAGPGVLLGAFLLAISLKIFLGYTDISWAGALTMGSILCATDPVAVVALLKELGASARLNTLIEGESLLNDGTAMVFYQLFLNMEKGQSSGPVDIVIGFVQKSIVGPLFGLLCGLIGAFWLRRIIRDDVLTCVVTFITCYLCFFISEFTSLQVSGILAIFALGLLMSAVGKTKIYPESEHAVHVVWAFVQYSCETLIFFLSGIIIGIQMISQSTITTSDWIRLFFFWGFMVAARFIMVITLYPLLRKFGYGITKPEVYVVVWGGLRGALGLTLALMVLVDDQIKSIRLKQLTIFYMAGSATLTLLINGTTCGALVNYLQLIQIAPIKTRILNNSLKNMYNRCVDKEKELRTNNFFALTDWDKVYQISGMEDFRNKLFEGKPEVTLGRKSTYSSFNEPEILQELRFRYLRGLKSLCWEQYENRYIGSGAAKWLEEGLNMALDDLTVPLKTWDMTYMNFTGFKILKMMFYMRNTPVIGKIARNYITNHLSFVYEVTTSFIVISHEIQEHNHELPISKDYTHVMNQEMNQNIVQAEKYIAELAYNFPELIKTIHTKRASYNIIEAQKKFLLQYKDSGYIDNTDYNILRSEVDQRTLSLQNMAFDWTIPTFQNFLLEFPIFSTLTPEQISLIRASFTQKSLSAGTEIYQKGQPFQGIYFVTQGSVDDKVTGDISLNIGIGGFLSFANCICENEEQSYSTAIAYTNCILNQIPFYLIKNIMKENRSFEQKIYLKAMIYFVRIYADKAGILKNMEENKLNEYCSKSEQLVLNVGQIIQFSNGGYLITGLIQDANNVQNPEHYNDFSYIQPSKKMFKAVNACHILQFQNILQKKQKQQVLDGGQEEKINKQFKQNVNNLKNVSQNNKHQIVDTDYGDGNTLEMSLIKK